MQNSSFAESFGLKYPIVLGPFGGGLSSVALTTLVSNAGGLGSFGCHYMTNEQIRLVAREISDQTKNPFALNLWVRDHDPDALRITKAQYEAALEPLKPLFERFQVPLPAMPERFGQKFDEQIDAVFAAKPAVFSFVFGIPSAEVLKECRKRGIRTVGAATTLEEALALEAAEVDAIVASGFEGGGHRGSFLRPAERSLHGTFSLVQLISARTKKPVIAAGGIVDGRGMKAAFELGASAAQIGSAFLACDESNAHPEHKKILRSGAIQPTVLTKIFTGRSARGIENEMVRTLEKPEVKIAPYPVQTWLTGKFKAAALANNEIEFVSLWAGQSYPLIKHTRARDLMDSLIQDLRDRR